MTFLRAFKTIMLLGFVLVAAVVGITYATNLMTSPDTLSVALGSVLFILTLAACGAIGFKCSSSNLFRPFHTLALLFLLAGCTRVEPGWEGVRVHLVGTERGVDAYPIVTGRVFFNPITYDIYKFPTFLQRVVWTADDSNGSPRDDSFTFRSREGYSFNADVGFGFSFVEGQGPFLFERYRRTAGEITDGPFRDIVREAFVEVGSQMEGLSILGEGVIALNEGVTEVVRQALMGQINIEYVNMVGQPRVDERVEMSINAVIEATQRANEAEETVRQREFEAQQRVAQATGVAEALRIEAQARAEAIEIEATALRQFGSAILQMRSIEKWDGVMPIYMGGDMPFITVPAAP